LLISGRDLRFEPSVDIYYPQEPHSLAYLIFTGQDVYNGQETTSNEHYTRETALDRPDSFAISSKGTSKVANTVIVHSEWCSRSNTFDKRIGYSSVRKILNAKKSHILEPQHREHGV
jgi:hypothetical protein